jgi:hypothetical protein
LLGFNIKIKFREEGKKFLTEVIILEKSQLIGKTVKHSKKKFNLNIVELIRLKGNFKSEDVIPKENIEERPSIDLESRVSLDISSEAIMIGNESVKVSSDHWVYIVPVEDTQLLQKHDRLIISGEFEEILKIHEKLGVSLVDVN